jgi:hypothetical protein
VKLFKKSPHKTTFWFGADFFQIMSERIEINTSKLDSMVCNAVYGYARLVVHGKNGDKAIIDNGKYMLKKNGVYDIQGSALPRDKISDVLLGLIEKYKHFEYDGNLYHNESFGLWLKEKL